jgi:uncharacterized protein YfeS
MSTILYFDDPDVGLARETSHPTFARIAAQDFYYDCGDDFSPFGSDDGSDTLAALEEWYQEQTGGKRQDPALSAPATERLGSARAPGHAGS